MATRKNETKADGKASPTWGDVAAVSDKIGAKQAEAAFAKRYPPRKLTLPLPVKLTAGERDKIADEIEALTEEQASAEECKKAAASKAKAEIEILKQRIVALRKARKDGAVERPIACELTYEYRTGAKTTVRLDTGETVKTEAMTREERQGVLFPGDEASAKPASLGNDRVYPSGKAARRSKVSGPSISDPQAVLDAMREPKGDDVKAPF